MGGGEGELVKNQVASQCCVVLCGEKGGRELSGYHGLGLCCAGPRLTGGGLLVGTVGF